MTRCLISLSGILTARRLSSRSGCQKEVSRWLDEIISYIYAELEIGNEEAEAMEWGVHIHVKQEKWGTVRLPDIGSWIPSKD